MKHIFAYRNDFVIYSGYINVEKIQEEKRGNLTYIHIYVKDEYDRSERKYWVGKWSCYGDGKFISGDREVYTEFEF